LNGYTLDDAAIRAAMAPEGADLMEDKPYTLREKLMLVAVGTVTFLMFYGMGVLAGGDKLF
jgi:hypothetical protein